ncbi:hypothetical protein NLJ89_g4285 [Agrocybe chaxingu]|uniref:HECT domain-containing protein n=1 Tax=Agrocybe chaxingu TaxID=84603 RepID=A0A9W8K345_9AGAR|nr:hypothetical protein NLJ89_g4285 [Agrocybe chaxingu]
MDNPHSNNLSEDEIAQLHQLLGRFRSSNGTRVTQTATPASSQPPSHTQPEHIPRTAAPILQESPSSSANVPPASTVVSSIPSQAAPGYPGNRTIAPYQSMRLGLRDPQSSTSLTSTASQSTSTSNTGINSAFTGQGYPSVQRPPTFLGFQGMTSQANQQRMASASTHLVRRPALPTRTQTRRSTRGHSIRPPSLPRAPSFDDCVRRDEYGRPVAISLRAKIYPPLNDTVSEYFVHRFYVESFNSHLLSLGLLRDFETPLTTSVTNLINRISTEMENGPFAFRFSRRAGVLEHEDLPIGLLGFVNRGRPRPSDNQIRLRIQPIPSVATIETLLSTPNLYAIPDLCIEDGRYVLHFAILRDPLTALYRNIDGTGELRRHSHQEEDDNATSGGDDSSDSENGDVDSDGDVAMNFNAAAQANTVLQHPGLRPHVPATRVEASLPPPAHNVTIDELREPPSSQRRRTDGVRSASSRHARVSSQGQGATNSTQARISSYTVRLIPATLWSTQWSPPETNDLVLISELDTSFFDVAAGEDDMEKLELCGQNVMELAEQLRLAISQAVTRKDFSKVLSPTREFKITYIDSEGRQRMRSVGRGIKREAVYIAFSKFSQNPSQWFLPRVGEYSSIATTHSLSRPSVSSTRLHSLSILGALAALMLVYGMAPDPLSPVLLHYFIHDCNIESIHSNLLSEWVPDLYRTIRAWIDADQTSDLTPFEAHFATFHDLQIATLQERDYSDHQALATEMLHRAIVGPEPSDHPEIQAFLAGFKMPCSNGFVFTDVKKFLQGGSEALINMVWSGSHIKTFEDLKPHIRLTTPLPSVAVPLAAALAPHALTFEQLLHGFLEGSGVPCPALFESAKLHFSPIVNLSNIDSLSISVVSDTDVNYAYSPRRDFMLREGKLSFRTV